MGIPYSRQINTAFTQVTPLVAAGFDVLRTTRNTSVLLACIQILTCALLALILLALLGVICTLDPALKTEEEVLVTPAVRWVAGWALAYGAAAGWVLRAGVVVATAGLGVFFWQGGGEGGSGPGTPVVDDWYGGGPG